jgi:stage II sporulation protein GA (sporulation sigma-E factor processing peptidase)
MIVYADLVFLTNLFFDAALLITTAYVRKLKLSRLRLAVSASAGAAYAAMMTIPGLSWLYGPPAKLAVLLMMVCAAFGYGSLPHFARNAGAFFAVHFAAAGAMFAAEFLLLSSGDAMARFILQPSGKAAFAVESGLWLSFPVFLLSLWLFRSVLTAAKRTEAVHRFLADVCVEIGGHSRTCKGLIDTGNQLYDPLTRAPVMVMESGLWKGLLPESWLNAVREGRPEEIADSLGGSAQAGAGSGDGGVFPEILPDWPGRLRFIPYRGINRDNRLMLAFKPDKVEVSLPGKKVESRKVLVALDGGTLSPAGAYRAIVHPMLVES